MEAPAPTPRPRILGHSSMFCFFRSLARSRDSRKSPGQALVPELRVSSLMPGCQGGGRREAGPPATLQGSPSVATPKGSTHLPWLDLLGLDMGDMGVHTPDPKEVLRVPAQAMEVKAVLPTGSQEVLGNPSEEGREKEQPASRDSGYLAWALEVEQDHLQRALGPVEDTMEAITSEDEETEHLLEGDPSLASSKAGLTPWNRLLSLYKQLQKSALVQEALLQEEEEEEEEEEEMEDENSSLQLCVPGSGTLQSPLTKTFQPTDTVGFVESELKKLLAGQQESHLWKMGSQEGRKLLSQPESTLEEAGVVNGQHPLSKEVDEMGDWLL